MCYDSIIQGSFLMLFFFLLWRIYQGKWIFSLSLPIKLRSLRNKELKIEPGQLQEEITKASLLVSADLCNDFTFDFKAI